MIYITSDTHFCHNKEFLFKPRGFDTIDEHDQKVIENWNSVVSNDDDVYHLGDVLLSDTEKGIECLKQLNGKIHLIRGNHDTNAKLERIKECSNVVEIADAKFFKYGKYHFFMSHYPCVTDSLNNYGGLERCMCNLYGHTHQQTNFYQETPFMYHVGLDSHNCKPISIEEVIKDIREEINKCIDNRECD